MELGLLNSRLKDFFDISYIARTWAFEGTVLQESIRATFDRRSTPIPQASIEAFGPDFFDDPIKQSQWAGFQERSGLEPQELEIVVEAVRELTEPVLAAIKGGRGFQREWPPGGPWLAAKE